MTQPGTTFTADSGSPRPVVLAVGCHPDDIEFMMAGTLLRLHDLGAEIHYFNAANGNCGSREYGRTELAALREAEAREASSHIAARWHPPIENDMEVTYRLDLVRKVASVVRLVAPDILLTLALHDYMEDHMNTARIAVTAAFTLGMPNFETDPPRETIVKNLAIYHALPYGLRDQLNNPVRPQFTVDIGDLIERKRAMLAAHRSQRNWLDDSQKLDSYLQAMLDQSAEVGRMAGEFSYAEGWSRHNPLGYSTSDFRPLEQLLEGWIVTL